ncbi:hypothetical protein [Bradyrhizobium sp. WSM471]|nr:MULTISPECIES: hypothetical protein [Bradyrhizobium]EHR01407.1 hypothetical protein Bra471DRAFT_02134 [Bradyrhizobium sp. WSM471]UFW43465.1 hypothetical protein BcanWSM471_10475 [Bradyrhizobium canariense]
METFEKLPLDELLRLRRAVRALIEKELERRIEDAAVKQKARRRLN